MTDHIIKAAKAAGGTTYTNRHHDGTACAFGPEALERFYALAYKQGLEDAAKVCESRVMGDHNREDAEADRCADAIRALKEQQHE